MEKRNTRTYKAKDKPYFKAKKRAKGRLATMVEGWITDYGNGLHIVSMKVGESNHSSKNK
jgi:hypothetical protein